MFFHDKNENCLALNPYFIFTVLKWIPVTVVLGIQENFGQFGKLNPDNLLVVCMKNHCIFVIAHFMRNSE